MPVAVEILILILVPLCFFCQLIQWVCSIYGLYDEGYDSKKEFLIALIPGMFVVYSIIGIYSFIDKFRNL